MSLLLAASHLIDNDHHMIRRLRLFTLLALAPLLASCTEEIGLDIAPEWKVDSIMAWEEALPDMLLLSRDETQLFVSCETVQNMLSPSLARIDLERGSKDILIYGLARADGLKMDSKGDIWLGEETEDGLIIRVTSPESLPAEQRFDRDRLVGSHPDITPVLSAGRFSHEGLAFSQDGRYLYLADEWIEGCLYRFEISSGKLQVFHSSKGWLKINTPVDSRFKAEVLHGRLFQRLEDMETMPDGRIVMAETGSKNGSGRIWILDDRGDSPQISVYLESPDIHHPDNLEWDSKRGWLWITDDHSPSSLWAYDGIKLQKIASHSSAEITGVESSRDGIIYLNLQHRFIGPDLTLKLMSQ